MSNPSMIDAWLQSYRPKLRQELVRDGELADYLTRKAEAMANAIGQMTEQHRARYPKMSDLQVSMEVEAIVNQTYLPATEEPEDELEEAQEEM